MSESPLDRLLRAFDEEVEERVREFDPETKENDHGGHRSRPPEGGPGAHAGDRAVPAAHDDVARLFHETYERLAPDYGYETRRESAVPWKDVPAANRALMNAVVREVFDVVFPRRYVTGMPA